MLADSKYKSRFLIFFFWMSIGVFLVNVLLHYFSQRPLWNDEICILDNIQLRNISELFAPLMHIQVFPRVYLAVIKLFSQPFNYSLLALRFPSLICMILGFFLWVNIYRRSLIPRKLVVLAVLAFAASYRLTYYAAELKPYSMDVLVVAATLMFCFYQNRSDLDPYDRPRIVLSMLLPFLILFSYGAIFVFWIPAYNLFWFAKKDKRIWPIFFSVLSATVLAGLIFYGVDLRYTSNEGGLDEYWGTMFIRFDSLSSFFGPLTEGTKELVTRWSGSLKWHRRAFMIFIPFFLYGLFWKGFRSWKRDGWRIDAPASFGLVLFLELFVLALLHKYPFTGQRVTLFFAPFAFYYILIGIGDFKGPYWLKNIFLGYFFAYQIFCVVNTAGIYINFF